MPVLFTFSFLPSNPKQRFLVSSGVRYKFLYILIIPYCLILSQDYFLFICNYSSNNTL